MTTAAAAGALGSAGALGVLWSLEGRRQDKRYAVLHRALVDVLLNALSAGDAQTERHSRRVGDLADVVFTVFHVDADRHATARLAALLHDMGKIDDQFFDILHSCRPLTAEERNRIKRHPDEGAAILDPIEKVHPGLTEIVEAHHECWDGTGYPNGLHSTRIPLEARIISVADVFDALTQKRTYHEAIDPDEAIRKIEAGSGSRFDPDVVARVSQPDIRAKWNAIVEEGRRREKLAAAV